MHLEKVQNKVAYGNFLPFTYRKVDWPQYKIFFLILPQPGKEGNMVEDLFGRLQGTAWMVAHKKELSYGISEIAFLGSWFQNMFSLKDRFSQKWGAYSDKQTYLRFTIENFWYSRQQCTRRLKSFWFVSNEWNVKRISRPSKDSKRFQLSYNAMVRTWAWNALVVVSWTEEEQPSISSVLRDSLQQV